MKTFLKALAFVGLLALPAQAQVITGVGGGLTLKRIDVFTSSGTFTKQSADVYYKIYIFGGGGGGASGAKQAVGTACGGGGAGGSGTELIYERAAQDTTATVTVTVGAGGIGGAVSANTSFGLTGTPGGASTFGNYAFGDSGYFGFVATGSAGGGGNAQATFPSYFPANGQTGGNGGFATVGNNGGYGALGPSGGGGGAGISAAEAVFAGGNSGYGNYLAGADSSIAAIGGAASTNGGTGATSATNYGSGSGGGGGGSSVSAAAGNGGNGGLGGGGGGGGCSRNTFGGGAGGNGGNGRVIVFVYG